MRLLIVPIPERPQDMDGDSTGAFTRFMAELAAARGWAVHLVVPEPLAYRGGSRIFVHRYGLHKAPLRNRQGIALTAVADALAEYAHGAPDALQFDAVVTTDTVAAYTFQIFLERIYGQLCPPVFVLATMIPYIGSTEVIFRTESDPISNVAALPFVDTFVGTDYQKARIASTARVHLGAALADKVPDRIFPTYAMVMCDRLDELAQPKREKTTLYWGGRFTGTRAGHVAVRDYLRYAMTGKDVGIVITKVGQVTGIDRYEQIVRKYGGQKLIELYQNLPQDDAWKIMSSCHVAMWPKTVRYTPASPFEWMYAGLATLVKNFGFERKMLPPDYPWIYENDREAAGMLAWVTEHWQEATREAPAWKRFVRDNYNRVVAWNRCLDHIEHRTTDVRLEWIRRSKTLEPSFDLVRTVLESVGEPCDWATFKIAVEKLKGKGFMVPYVMRRGYGLMAHHFRAFIPEVGWRDTCDTLEPQYVKSQEVPRVLTASTATTIVIGHGNETSAVGLDGYSGTGEVAGDESDAGPDEPEC